MARELLDIVLTRTDFHASVSYSIVLEIARVNPLLAERIRVYRIPLGVDEGVYKASPSEYHLDAFYFARLVPQKGVLDIPYIWKRVVKKYPEAKLGIAGAFGDESVKRQFFALLKRFGIEKNVVYYGYLPERELYGLVKASKLVVYPSYLDAFPLVVLESLASCRPVVAYDIPAIRYNYRTGAVIRIPLGDVEKFSENIDRLLEDDDLLHELSVRACSYASRYSWDAAAAEEATLVEELISDENRKSRISAS